MCAIGPCADRSNIQRVWLVEMQVENGRTGGDEILIGGGAGRIVRIVKVCPELGGGKSTAVEGNFVNGSGERIIAGRVCAVGPNGEGTVGIGNVGVGLRPNGDSIDKEGGSRTVPGSGKMGPLTDEVGPACDINGLAAAIFIIHSKIETGLGGPLKENPTLPRIGRAAVE